ncbi:MAG: hypothetical protein ACK5GJ_01045 [Planctomycetota bacterium]
MSAEETSKEVSGDWVAAGGASSSRPHMLLVGGRLGLALPGDSRWLSDFVDLIGRSAGLVSWRGCSDATPKRLARASQEFWSIDFSRGGSTGCEWAACSGAGASGVDATGEILSGFSLLRVSLIAFARGGDGSESSSLFWPAESFLVTFFDRGA